MAKKPKVPKQPKEKKEKKVKEPQYYTSALGTPTYNYGVYYFSKIQKVGYALAFFVVGGVIGNLFYGGLGRDSYGNPTLTTAICDGVFFVITGSIAVRAFMPVRANMIRDKIRKTLNRQFRDLLDSLVFSLSSGNNTIDAFVAAKADLTAQYGADAPIVTEVDTVIQGFYNNMHIEDFLSDFGRRSASDDILSFANVFEIAQRRGGNMRDVVRNSQIILSEKMEINEEIETSLASGKNDSMIMVVLPIIMVGIIKMDSSSSMAQGMATPTGVMSTTVAILLFFASFMVSSRIMRIKV